MKGQALGFTTLLYNRILGRAPEQEGLAAWVSRFDEGMTREEVVERFTQSVEFVNLCKLFGVIPYAGYTEAD